MKKIVLLFLGFLLAASFGCISEEETEYYVCPDGRKVLDIEDCVVEDETLGEEPQQEVPGIPQEEHIPQENASGEEDSGEPEQVPEHEGLMPAEYIDVTPEAAYELINMSPNLIVVDVSNSYAQGHLPGAVNHPYGDGTFSEAYQGWDPHVPYLVYCHSDSVSIAAAGELAEIGFTEVYRLKGNYGAWEAAGYPIEK
ncbi:hypothetical protein GF412_05155 [Candidatus Micrarchaeota archaeon]|nr:hypothetical protein [Candidatus Micrarchaeota archaeon]MBD3418342.1 hypothetical protein [Candidatus Micrarchaeota archaeon]